MRVLSIDQSSSRTGYAVGDLNSSEKHSKPQLIDYGQIIPSKGPIEARVMELKRDIESLADEYKPSAIVIEKHHLYAVKSHDVQVAMAGATLACKMAALRKRIPVNELLPQQWRSDCGIKTSKKSKESVKQECVDLMEVFYNLPKGSIRSHDEAEALAMLASYAYRFEVTA